MKITSHPHSLCFTIKRKKKITIKQIQPSPNITQKQYQKERKKNINQAQYT